MTDRLDEIFSTDTDSLTIVRGRIAEWASSLQSESKAVKTFTEFVAKNMRAKTWGHSPRKAFLIFSIASEDGCKATSSVKEASWESYFTYFIKVITKSSPLPGDLAAAIEAEDTDHCLEVSINCFFSCCNR